MSGAFIDTLSVSREILRDPRKVHTTSAWQIRAMARALVDIAAFEQKLAEDIESHGVAATPSPLSAPVAVAALKVIDLHSALGQSGDLSSDALADLSTAIGTLKTLFEKEFPHV